MGDDPDQNRKTDDDTCTEDAERVVYANGLREILQRLRKFLN